MRLLLRFLAASAAISLGACGLGPQAQPAWTHYDECLKTNVAFPAIAVCGKQRRQAECAPLNQCSPDGDALVAYADSLASSVERREMSDDDAKRRWIEFRTQTVASARQLAAQRAAVAAASGPTTCVRNGNVTNCY